MILEQQKQAIVLSEGEQSDVIKMSLDLDSAQFIMQELLSKGIYSNPITSTIRETVSNSLDSTRRAGTNKPIKVSLKVGKDGNYEFSVEDWGIGLDDKDVENIISKYGASTKRDSDLELGVFGIGFKSPLSYSSSFYFVCRKNGIERKYMMYEGEDVNSIDLLYETPTEEPNGVKVIIPVKYNDRSEFLDGIKEQLAYFEGVYFDVNIYGDEIKNDFKIFRTDDFQWSELSSDTKMHLCLDDVYYPLEFDALKIKPIYVPVALRFKLTDGIFPTINREAIRMSPEAKEIILNKIKKVADYFIEKYNATINDSDDVIAVLDWYKGGAKTLEIQGTEFTIDTLLSHSQIPLTSPKLKGVELLNLSDLAYRENFLLGEYKNSFELRYGKLKTVKYYNDSVTIKDVKTNSLMLFSISISGKKKEYLKELFSSKRYNIAHKEFFYRLKHRTYSRESYVSILSLDKYPKTEWRQRIKEFQYIQSLLINKLPNIDNIEIPKHWLDARKRATGYVAKTKKERKIQGEITGKEATRLERYVDGKNCKFVPVNYSLDKFPTFKFLTIYTTHENSNVLQELYKIKNSNMRFATFSEREIKIIKEVNIHNLMSYETFMEGNNKPFKRYVTAYLIEKLKNKHPYSFNKREHLKELSTSLFNKIDELNSYRASNYYNGSSYLYEEMVRVAEEYQLFDMSIYSTYLEVKSILEKYNFIEPIIREHNAYRQSKEEMTMIEILRDLFKYHKYKLNYENYGISLNEEEKLTEESIEQLTN